MPGVPDAAVIPEDRRGAGAAVRDTTTGLLQLPGHVIHAFNNTPETDEEKQFVQDTYGKHGLAPALGLGIYRLVVAPMQREHELAKAYETIADSKQDPVANAAQSDPKEFAKQQLKEHLGRVGAALTGPIGMMMTGPAASDMDARSMSYMHHLASIVPLLGPMAGDVMEHYKQNDPTGAGTEILSNIIAGKAMEGVTGKLAKGVSKIAPRTAKVAGEEVPIMAGQEKTAAPIAKSVASEPSAAIAEKQQTAAQAGVKNVASDALNRQMDNLNTGERRTDLAQRKLVSDMTPEERTQALLTSEKTGLPNRRAFDEAEQQGPAKAVGMSDADGLKALNDRFGYAAGDEMLKAKAEALKQAGLDAYHEKGDEFLYRGDSPQDLSAKLEQAREILRNRVIQVETTDGQTLQFKGADFSHGSGKDLSEAESLLKSNKSARVSAGERGARGELGGITQAGSEASPAVASASGGSNGSPASAQLPGSAGNGAGAAKVAQNPATATSSARAASFGDAAEQVRAAAQPTFKKLDQLSDNAFSTLQNRIRMATAAERRATTVEDMEKAVATREQAEKSIDDLIQQHASSFKPNELQNAQSAWRDMKVLENVHSYVEKAFSAPESVALKSNLVTRTLDGNKLTANLNSMVDKIPAEDLQRVLGPDGLNNLYEIGKLASKPETAVSVKDMVGEISNRVLKGGRGAAVGGALGGKVGAGVGATADAAYGATVRAIATKPRVADLMLKALRAGTPAKIYGPLIAAEIQKSQQDDSSK